jgi:two-component system LytT family sensor kinase
MASPFASVKFRLFFAACWMVIIIQHTLLLFFYDLPLMTALGDSLVSNSFLLLCCLLVITTLRYYLPSSKQYFSFFILCVVLTLLSLLLGKWILIMMFGEDANYYGLLQRSFGIRLSIGVLFLGCVALTCITWRRQQDQKEAEERRNQAEQLAREAELFKLRQQLQPHFLFNSLNSINALIGSNAVAARKMVQQLSEFLRGTIKKEETQMASFSEELQHLQLYLDIETIRFGNRLQTIINTAAECHDKKIPALLLQPVVENAIKFGLYDTTGEAVIHIDAMMHDNNLKITVKNSFDPETSAGNKGLGFGLQSIQRRLYLLFARTNLLNCYTEGNIFITELNIPQP